MTSSSRDGQSLPVPFIGAELRPRYPPDAVDNPAAGPEMPRDELHRRALEVLSLLRRASMDEHWWRQKPVRVEVPWTRTESGGVELSIPGSTRCSLNSMGAFIWERLLGERTLDDIAREIGREFNAEEEVIREDLICLMNEFHNQQLVTFRGEHTCR